MTSRHLLAFSTVAVAALAAVLIAALVLRSSDNSSAADFDGAIMPAGVVAPDFQLKDQTGKSFSMAQYSGKPVIVTFLYSHCKDTCPVQARLISSAVQELGHQVPVIAFSVDPAHDTDASVDQFMREQKVTANIRWGLGTRKELAPVWKGYAVTPQLDDAEHMARIVLVDKLGFQKIGYPLEQTTPDRIAHDMRLLEKQ